MAVRTSRSRAEGPWRLGYPGCSVRQLLAILWLGAILLALWSVPGNKGRSLFVAAPNACAVKLGNQRPLAAIVQGDSYQILDCQTRKVLHQGSIRHRLPLRHVSRPWNWPLVLPSGYYEGENPWSPYGCNSRFARFSEDDRFLVIRSSIEESPVTGITLVETSTGRELTWVGEQTNSILAETLLKPDSATIYSHGKQAAQLKATPPFEPPLPREMSPDVSGLAVWYTDWNIEQQRRVSLYQVDRSEEQGVNAEFLGPSKSEVLIWRDQDAIQLQNAQSGEPIALPKTFDSPDTRVRFEGAIADSHFILVDCESALPDRLGSNYQQLLWNVKDGRALEFLHWHCSARQKGEKLLVDTYDQQLFWFDPRNGARENLFTPGRYRYGREAMMLAWGVAWWFLARPTEPRARSRALGYLLAICAIIAIAPPYLPIFSPYFLAQGYHWLFTIAALLPLAIAALAAALRRTASLPLLVVTLVSLGFLLLAWGHRGGLDSSANGGLAMRAWNGLPLRESDEEPDFFRPWRFGAPPPDPILHVEFRTRVSLGN